MRQCLLFQVVLTFDTVEMFYSMTIQIKVTEQYFPVVLFIMLYKVILTFELEDEIRKCDHSQIKAIKNYFLIVLFIMLNNVVFCLTSYGVTIQMKTTEYYFPMVLLIFRYFPKKISDIFLF